MIPKGLFTQIAMIVVSGGIIITYVQPMFAEIGETQNDIAVYREEQKKVAQVNQQLATLSARLDQISALDQRKLLTYMPDRVDNIAVPRILQFIAQEAGVIFVTVSYGEVADDLASSYSRNEAYPVPHTFDVTVEGTYSQIKRFLRLLEQNEFPLEAHGLNIQVVEGGLLSAQVRVITYAHNLDE